MQKEVQQYCLKLSESKIRLVLALREMVLFKNIQIKEKIKFGRITFTYKENDLAFICVKSTNKHIELGFFKGNCLVSNQEYLFGKNNSIRRFQIYEMNENTIRMIDVWLNELLLN